MTKLLILSSDTGEGHNSAAAAIENAARSAGLEATIRKPLEGSTKLNRSLGKFYNALLTYRPQWMSLYFSAAVWASLALCVAYALDGDLPQYRTEAAAVTWTLPYAPPAAPRT